MIAYQSSIQQNSNSLTIYFPNSNAKLYINIRRYKPINAKAKMPVPSLFAQEFGTTASERRHWYKYWGSIVHQTLPVFCACCPYAGYKSVQGSYRIRYSAYSSTSKCTVIFIAIVPARRLQQRPTNDKSAGKTLIIYVPYHCARVWIVDHGLDTKVIVILS